MSGNLPSLHACEESIRATIAELHDEAKAPAILAATPRAADRIRAWRLIPAEAVEACRVQWDYRERAAELLEHATPEDVAALKWRAIDAALGIEEPADISAEGFAEAAHLLRGEEERQARVAALPRGYSVGELLATDFLPPTWIIPELLTTGLTILAGAPKLGKSWLALTLGAGIGSGGAILGAYRVERRNALYLALEDTPRRIRGRLEKIGAAPSSLLTIYTKWRSGAEGLADLDAYLVETPSTHLVIIDTFARFRGAPTTDDKYTADYSAAAAIKDLADQRNCAIVLIHHTRKLASEDAMELVSGTNGLNGAADATWILTRARGEADASLFMTGRDIEERSLALRFDSGLGTWQALGDAAEFAQTRERRDILSELEEGREVKTGDLARALDKTPQAISNRLRDLEREGLVYSPRYGYWALKGRVTRETVNPKRETKQLNDFHGSLQPRLPYTNEDNAMDGSDSSSCPKQSGFLDRSPPRTSEESKGDSALVTDSLTEGLDAIKGYLDRYKARAPVAAEYEEAGLGIF